MMIRSRVFDEIGFLDEGFFLNYEETDFCLRALRADWPCWYVPESRIMHIGYQSIGLAIRERELEPDPLSVRPRAPAAFLRKELRDVLCTLAADLAFGTGLTLRRMRCALQLKNDDRPQLRVRDFWAHSVASLSRTAPSIPDRVPISPLSLQGRIDPIDASSRTPVGLWESSRRGRNQRAADPIGGGFLGETVGPAVIEHNRSRKLDETGWDTVVLRDSRGNRRGCLFRTGIIPFVGEVDFCNTLSFLLDPVFPPL